MSVRVLGSSAATHAGSVRSYNEDALVHRPEIGLWAVADGAGGHQAGDLASRLVTDALQSIDADLSAPEMLAQVRLQLDAVHAELRREADRRGPDAIIASTVVVLIVRDGHYACLWAGDSRAYLLRDGMLSRLSRDHSLVQELVDLGRLTDAEALVHPRANVITRAVGAVLDSLVLDKVSGPLRESDAFLLCSDGVDKCLSEQALADLLGQSAPDAAATAVIAAALEQGAADNITAVSVRVGT